MMIPAIIWGDVVGGKRVGHTIGFPTANVRPHPGQTWPQRGVYAGDIRIGAEKAWRRCIVNCGIQPTIPFGAETIEVHILDFDRDIYGTGVELVLREWLRSERKFDSIDQLRAQLARDAAAARALRF